jgi:hypothetical protein
MSGAMDGMTTPEIETLMFRLFASSQKPLSCKFLGVFSFDHMPSLFTHHHTSCCCIVNIDPSTKPGSHWVAFFFHSPLNCLEFFDSYGNPPSVFHFTFTNLDSSPHKPRLVYNSLALQSFTTTVCGQYCILFCYFRSMLSSSASAFNSTISALAKLAPSKPARDVKIRFLVNHLLHTPNYIPASALTYRIPSLASPAQCQETSAFSQGSTCFLMSCAN